MVADVLAVVDLGSTDANFVTQAEQFAHARNARLTIAVAAPVSTLEFSLAAASGYPLTNELARYAKDKKSALAGQFATIGRPVHFCCYEGEIAELGKMLSARASVGDLTLVGPPGAYGHHKFRSRVLGDLALFSGRPVLAVPPRGAADRFDHIVIGWNGSREAARVLNDALPLLESHARIDIVSVSPGGSPGALDPISEHLTRLGYAPTQHALSGADATSDLLLRFVDQLHAQLLAVGAFAHSRFEEVVLGGVTRDLVEGAPVPVLFSH
ncbi:universal stress protein [Sphingomonas sp. MMSM20]|uniref:universal stress protein n=1 Tax=Sphingomonas lycopersici TaxID=2951807 RepID=UPI0022377E76|nr:universal stress protein [Sphingomonas lycopersici]MCW6530208.1 universal stress protein [Sphingomonas lycopersici]